MSLLSLLIAAAGAKTSGVGPVPADQMIARQGWRNELTSLPPQDEAAFRDWVSKRRVPFNPNDPNADYDMRGYWRAMRSGDPRATQALNPNDRTMHFPDYWKTPFHQSFSAESKFAGPGAPSWNARDQLVDPAGRIVFDERNQKRPRR